MATRWDPDQYLKYRDERSRPFDELVSRIRHPHPERVIDLGCGPGTTTALLLQRWPSAHVLGVDSSEEMIERAQALAVPERLEFAVGDIRDAGWTARGPFDVLLCCATLQWVPDHVEMFPSWLGSLNRGGVFAFQVPWNFDEPSHTLLFELASSQRWSKLLAHLVRREPVLDPAAYLRALLDMGAAADVWTTTYFHVLHGPDPVLEWVTGTALRPFLSSLEAGEGARAVAEFLSSYGEALRAAYPPDGSGRTIFPFRRIFAVATVSS